MTFGWIADRGSEWLLAAARVDSGTVYYVGLAVVLAIVIGTMIAFYRTWAEIHEDIEPDSPQDLLESFREAHAAGEIDDRELERVSQLLASGEAGAGAAGSPGPPRRPSTPEGSRSRGPTPTATGPNPTESLSN